MTSCVRPWSCYRPSSVVVVLPSCYRPSSVVVVLPSCYRPSSVVVVCFCRVTVRRCCVFLSCYRPSLLCFSVVAFFCDRFVRPTVVLALPSVVALCSVSVRAAFPSRCHIVDFHGIFLISSLIRSFSFYYVSFEPLNLF